MFHKHHFVLVYRVDTTYSDGSFYVVSLYLCTCGERRVNRYA